MSDQEIERIRREIMAQGAVINPPNPLLKAIQFKLFLKTPFAVPGAGLYYTSRDDVFRLEIDLAWLKHEAHYAEILQGIDSCITYLDKVVHSDRLILSIQIDLKGEAEKGTQT